MQTDLFERVLTLNVASSDLAGYYRVADVLATAGDSLEPWLNIVTGLALLSIMVLVVSVATLNSRREWLHNMMTLVAFLTGAFGLFVSYYYTNQLDIAVANAHRTLITASDWAAYLRVTPRYHQAYGQVYGLWGTPYNLFLTISAWALPAALGIAMFTVSSWSGPPTCKVCMRNYTLVDRKERKWYCATDDRLYLAEQHQVIENASKQGLLATEVKAKAGEIARVMPKPEPSMMFCRECGAKIRRESKFCGECGARLV
jgi:hypothetical protein